MEIIIERAAALDVHKKSVTACVRTPDGAGGRSEQIATFATFLDGLVELRGWLVERGVSHVVMEATSSYWLPVWRVLEEDGDFEQLWLVNAKHFRHVPGRKTDVKDASWLCQLFEVGLLRPSFVPAVAIRQLRVVTRYRKQLIRLRAQQVQRIEKTLEDAVIKLGAVASKTLTVSGRAMIEALIAGERDPEQLAGLAKARLRAKVAELTRALDGRFATHHATHLRQLLDLLDYYDTQIEGLDTRIGELTRPWAELLERLTTIPGVARRTAEVIIAETGADMARFPTAGHLASWAGLCPGQHESAGKRRSGRTTHGDRWLAEQLVEAAWSATQVKDTYLREKFYQLAGPRPDPKRKNKAIVGVAHKLLIAAYHIMATPEQVYRELGAEHLTNRDHPDRRRDRLVAQLTKLGYDVELTPTTAAS